MHLTYRRMGIVLALIAMLAAPSWAQQQTGSISGRAEDSSGAALPGVTVSIVSDNLIGGARTAVTDDGLVALEQQLQGADAPGAAARRRRRLDRCSRARGRW